MLEAPEPITRIEHVRLIERQLLDDYRRRGFTEAGATALLLRNFIRLDE